VAWVAREVRGTWAASAGGPPGARSVLVAGSEGGSGVAGVRSARAVLAVSYIYIVCSVMLTSI
jgi:hypothetical protein